MLPTPQKIKKSKSILAYALVIISIVSLSTLIGFSFHNGFYIPIVFEIITLLIILAVFHFLIKFCHIVKNKELIRLFSFQIIGTHIGWIMSYFFFTKQEIINLNFEEFLQQEIFLKDLSIEPQRWILLLIGLILGVLIHIFLGFFALFQKRKKHLIEIIPAPILDFIFFHLGKATPLEIIQSEMKNKGVHEFHDEIFELVAQILEEKYYP